MASYKDTLLEFPCDFPLKIMGKAEDELAQVVLEIVTKHAPGFDGPKAPAGKHSGRVTASPAAPTEFPARAPRLAEICRRGRELN